MAKKLIDISHISKSYGDNLVLDDLNLYINENKFLTLLGPSGCGKTTLLRILGGFETPDMGNIVFDGIDITNLAPNKRQLNTVFQKYALFTHMTIAENIAFGLKIKGKSKAYINDKIKYALKLVNLDGYENRMADQLSGGQQQRIAIARAIVNEPKVLLLDEPLGALDLKLHVVKYLETLGHEVVNFGTDTTDSCDYPVFAEKVCKAVLSGECDKGILICGTGIGISIAANKIHGIRCALCSEPCSAKLTREHNDANVLAMGARIIGPVLAEGIVDAFLTTEFSGGRHQRRVDMITKLEQDQTI